MKKQNPIDQLAKIKQEMEARAGAGAHNMNYQAPLEQTTAPTVQQQGPAPWASDLTAIHNQLLISNEVCRKLFLPRKYDKALKEVMEIVNPPTDKEIKGRVDDLSEAMATLIANSDAQAETIRDMALSFEEGIKAFAAPSRGGAPVDVVPPVDLDHDINPDTAEEAAELAESVSDPDGIVAPKPDPVPVPPPPGTKGPKKKGKQ